jgi:hypothetical protein
LRFRGIGQLPVQTLPLTRRHPERALEAPMEVTLVGKAKVCGDRDNRDASSQPLLRFEQLEMDVISVQWQSVRFLELPC